MAWFRRKKQQPAGKGYMETITPGLITGWAHHPTVPLVEVRLLVGPHLVAQARIDRSRPDLSQQLGVSGPLAFELPISAELPQLVLAGEHRVLAVSADGATALPLRQLGANLEQTADALAAALQPELRGLRGHFDGVSSDGRALVGWCERQGRPQDRCSVWLQADGQAPLELVADQHRPGMASQGISEWSGLRVELSRLAGWAGLTVWLSFDREGRMRLPQAGPVQIPVGGGAAVQAMVVPGGGQGVLPASGGDWQRASAEAPEELQDHWQEVERFRRMLDGVEQQLQQAQQVQAAAERVQRLAPPTSKRSARFKLWR